MEFHVLRGVPPEDVRELLAMGRRRTFERDEVVFHQGDVADALHLVTKGRFAIRIETPLGRSAMLAVRGPGNTFGELALLASDVKRAVTVSGLERGETLSVGRDAFLGLAARHPGVKDVLVAILFERLRRQDERIVAAHFLDADARVRWALLQLEGVYGNDEGFVVPLTQESLAELAGTARGTVNRVLREEEARGIVALERGRIRVLDPGALAAKVRGLPRT